MKKRRKILGPSKKEQMIHDVSSFLGSEYEEIAVAYLFGSFTTDGPFGDIDLAVLISDDLDNPLGFEIDLETALEEKVGLRVDVRILNRAPVSFCQNVIRTGKVILERDPNLRADFQGKILKQYFDFSRFRRRYLQEVVNAPL